MMVSSSVLFPTPLRPSTARLPFSGTSSETASSTTASPYPARTALSASSGSAMAPSAEIDLAHARIGGDLLRRALGEDAAADHDDDPAREPEHDVHVVLDEQHGDVGGEPRDRGEQAGALVARHARRRLVEQEHLRPGRE